VKFGILRYLSVKRRQTSGSAGKLSAFDIFRNIRKASFCEALKVTEKEARNGRLRKITPNLVYRIVKHAGETVLKLMIDLEKLDLFKGIRRKFFELSLCSDR
jgi:hypothetical protein